jgi:hypothetical protein
MKNLPEESSQFGELMIGGSCTLTGSAGYPSLAHVIQTDLLTPFASI